MIKNLFTILFIAGSTALWSQPLPIVKSGTYRSGGFNNNTVWGVNYDRTSQRVFYINENNLTLNILDISNLSKIVRIKQVDLSQFIDKVNYISVNLGVIAVSGEGTVPQVNGKVLLFNKDGILENQLAVGPRPKMITFAPNGSFLLVANEGFPSDDYLTDPEGSVSIINMGSGPANLTSADVQTVGFDTLNFWNLDPEIRIFGNNGQQTVAQDLEPEYIAINPASTKAYVSLQKNNALMIIDIWTASIDTIISFGYMDRSISGNGLDASTSNNNINISTYPNLFAMYQPGAMHSFAEGGVTYLATANEGSIRENSVYSERSRVNITPLDPMNFNPAHLQQNDSLGLLTITNTKGDMDGDGLFDSLYTFGSRSFSIRDQDGNLLWDSGDDFEQIIAQAHPANFNSDFDDNNSFKSRSDDRGPEPSAIAVGKVDGKLYAFIALERMGGIMIYDLSNPAAPQFVQYELNRDFQVNAQSPDAGDLGTETMQFVPAVQSPTSFPMLVLANAVSGNVSIYEMGQGVSLEEYPVETLQAYPNPTAGKIELSRNGNYQLYNIKGEKVMDVENSSFLEFNGLPEGVYILKSAEGEVIKVLKKY